MLTEQLAILLMLAAVQGQATPHTANDPRIKLIQHIQEPELIVALQRQAAIRRGMLRKQPRPVFLVEAE